MTWRQGEAEGVGLSLTGADGVDAPPAAVPAVPVARGVGLAGALGDGGADVDAWRLGLLAGALGAALVAWPPPVWVRLGAGLSEPFGKVTMPGLLDGTVVFTSVGLAE